MRKLTVFNNVTLDGYFTSTEGDMSWAHRRDPEFNAFVQDNAKGGGVLVFGRVTYQMMAGYWPTQLAREQNPVVAERINAQQKVVFSRTLSQVSWQNTALLKGDLATEISTLKRQAGPDLVVLGSGRLVAQLAAARLVDEYQLVMVPVVLGAGRTLFEGLPERLGLQLLSSRTFGNGNVFLRYAPAG
ncbi:dihydrofolate reductase family protein [Bradyrhizobium sp. 2TAF24]|uniref:dihydrofolate reductase family protein n=1 Tax=Bradyrhizobium sp. 2TAF24 TaxID=3233011 RepID=UPI003F93D116